ncbi:MAG: energy transducer TonB [Flavobacteriales bacterium]|nr:energy transducer TonB [Flavobacteriales bacterium]
MELIQNKNSRSGLIGTILVHLLLLLMFLSFGMTYQDPPPENEGAMMINFGTSDEGSGEVEAEEAANSTSESVSPSENSSAAEEQVLTQDNVEAPTVNSSETQTTETTTQEEQVASDNLLNALDAANNADEGNQGETGNSGNQGDPNGDPNSHGNSVGSGGIGFSLGTRGKVSFKKPDNPTQEDGKVVVDIWVNRAGEVLKAKAGARGSTTTNPILQKKAEEAAYKAKFKKDANAPFEQKGTMTFVFILN